MKLTGRTREKKYLIDAVDKAVKGHGQIILIAGEMGVGKTTLIEETVLSSGLQSFVSRCNEHHSPPYGPIAELLRNCIAQSEDGKIDCGNLTKYLPLILPELGEQPEQTDETTLKEAITAAVLTNASINPTVIVIEDLQWSDDATLNLLTSLSDRIIDSKMLIICTYLTDEISGTHRLKKFRYNLRRRKRLTELILNPLSFDETRLMITELTNTEPDETLCKLIFDKTNGFPLFINEIVHSLIENNRLLVSNGKLTFTSRVNIDIPDSIKDTILNQLSGLSNEALSKLEIAALTGDEFNPDMIIQLSGSLDGLEDLIEKNIIIEADNGKASFRHPIIKDVIKEEINWAKKKSYHKSIAEYLVDKNDSAPLIAEHFLSANENEKAIIYFLQAAESFVKIYAFTDAAAILRKALSLWGDGNDASDKCRVLFLYAHCTQMSGELNQSVKALRDITENYGSSLETNQLAEAFRSMATVYALMGEGELSAEARLKAGELFYQSGLIQQSALELLIAAGRFTAMLMLELAHEYAVKSYNQAIEANSKDLESQALALSGNILAMQGKYDEGRNAVQDALAIAVKNNLTDAASIIYRRLASTLEYASDYRSAVDAYYNAYNYCVTEGKEVSAQICLGCMSNTLFLTGDWKRSLEICDDVINNNQTPEGSLLIGYGIKGIILAIRGEVKNALKYLDRAMELSRKQNIIAGEQAALWGLAILYEIDSDIPKAERYYTSVLNLWEKSQDRHDIIIIFIWAVCFFSVNNYKKELTKCTEALSTLVSITGKTEALTGLSFAIAENAVSQKNYDLAIKQYNQAIEHLNKLQIPFLQMLVYYRLGSAYIFVDDKSEAKKYLLSAVRIAKNLGARPYSKLIETQLVRLGVKTEESRNAESAERVTMAGLTRRQSEILELIAEGLTNKEIAEKLFLSTRTVDMHVSNILQRLNCSNRTEAIYKARSLNIVD